MSSSIAIRPAVAQTRRAVAARPVAAFAGRPQPFQRRSSTGSATDRWRAHAGGQAGAGRGGGGRRRLAHAPGTSAPPLAWVLFQLSCCLAPQIPCSNAPLPRSARGRRVGAQQQRRQQRSGAAARDGLLRRQRQQRGAGHQVGGRGWADKGLAGLRRVHRRGVVHAHASLPTTAPPHPPTAAPPCSTRPCSPARPPVALLACAPTRAPARPSAHPSVSHSLLLGVFVLTLPLTIASVGRRLWIR